MTTYSNILTYMLSGIFMLVITGINSQTVLLNEVVSYNSTVISPESETYFDWVEIYNTSDTEVNLSAYYLTDDITEPNKWPFPAGAVIAPAEYKVIWLVGNGAVSSDSEWQANFKLNSEGESLHIYSESLELADSSPDWHIQQNKSLGRIANDSQWYYMDLTSPEEENQSAVAFSSVAQFPVLSHANGLYDESFLWDFTKDNAEDELRFTTDGSDPTSASPVLEGAFLINSSTTIKLRVYREGALSSEVMTNTYIIEPDLDLDILSISCNPDDLFGSNGIYTNYFNGEEKEVSVELFIDGNTAFKQNMGVKIHGPDGRDQKSLRLYARSEYGKSTVDYPLFEDKTISSFKRLVLRNAGNDGAEIGESHIRDILGHQLYLESDESNGNATHRAVNVIINGEYWGIYNLRERQDEHYLKSNYGYDEDQVDFLEYDYAEPNYRKTISGDWEDWEALEAFVDNSDLSVQSNYQIVSDWVDVDNFIDYQLFQIIMGNKDWCNNNTKFWKPINNGKWKWIMWDVEYGLGTFENYSIGLPSYDFITMAYTWCGWGSSDFAWLFRGMLDNEEFKTKYITRVQDVLNTSFRVDHIHSEIAGLASDIEPDLDRQFSKWGSNQGLWQGTMDELNYFVEFRPEFALDNMSSSFEFSEERQEITIDISDELAGEIKLNTLVLNSQTIGSQGNTFPWAGTYYQEQLIQLEAVEYANYDFSHWEGDVYSEEAIITLYPEDDLEITAVYIENPEDPSAHFGLVINEVLSSNEVVFSDSFGEYEDWIELYNGSDSPMSLTGLYLSDDENDLLKFEIPLTSPEVEIASNGHIVFFADNEPDQGAWHTNFQLNQSGEQLFLSHIQDGEVVVIDEVMFGALNTNHSYGRAQDGAEEWVTFEIPTPEATNEQLVHISLTPKKESSLLVFPNPSKGEFTVRLSGFNSSNQDIKIYNSIGQQVYTDQLNKEITRLHLQQLNPGIYIIEVGSKAFQQRMKLVIE